MTFVQLLRLLLTRWKILAIGAVIGFSLLVLWSLITSPMYRATAQVIVDVRPPETLGGAQVAVDQLSPDYLATQMDILTSERISRIVVQRMQLATNSSLLTKLGWDGTGSIEDFLAGKLQLNLKVAAASVASRVISVTYAANTPSFAANTANAFAQAYVDTVLDLQSQPARDSAAWYQRRAREVQKELAEAQSRLTIRQRELGVTTDINQVGSDDTRLQALSAQLAAVQAQDAMTAGKGIDLPGVLANPVVQQLQTEAARLEGQRRQLAQTAGPNNPDYRQVVGQLAAVKSQLAAQQQQVQQGSRVAATQTSSSVAKLTAAVATEKQQVIDAKARRDEVAVLAQDVRNLQTMYDQMAARRSQLDLLGDSTQSNVTILTPATPPDLPYWPRKKLMGIAGILLGGMIAAAVVIFREFVDQRIRGGEDFETWLGIPDLGALRIAPPAPRRLPARAAHRVAGLLPFRGKGKRKGDEDAGELGEASG